jgi:hypothetical protein
MNESQWLSGCMPLWMLEHLRPHASERKLLLFGAACARRIWHLLPGDRSHHAVELTERYADGELSRPEFRRLWNLSYYDWTDWAVEEVLQGRAADLVLRVADWARVVVGDALTADGSDVEALRVHEQQAQADLLRDIFGNPFRPRPPEPTWLRWHEGALTGWARSIYEGRQFAELPILADALEDAGCDDPDLLAHCRGGGEHVRGCWVLDHLLGKT